MVGIASRYPFEGIVLVAKATFFLYLRFARSLDYARDDKQLRDWLSPRLSFRPEKIFDFWSGEIFSFFHFLTLLSSWEYYYPFRLSEWNEAHGEICVFLFWALALDLSAALEMTLARRMFIHQIVILSGV